MSWCRVPEPSYTVSPVVGVVGAFIGSYVLGLVGLAIGGGFVAAVINALIGAVILLFLIGLIKRA